MWPGEADKVNARGNWGMESALLPMRHHWHRLQPQRAAQSLQRPDSEFRLHGFGMERASLMVSIDAFLAEFLQRLLLCVGRVSAQLPMEKSLQPPSP